MTSGEFTIEFGGVTYSGLQLQDVHKPTLLCLHGYLDNAASFTPLFPYLKDYNVIALDLCGHGQSFHRANGHAYHLTDYVFDVVAFLISYLEHRNENSVFVVGHSLGGIVGSILASTYPELVKAFVSIEACGPLSEDETTTSAQIKQSVASRLKIHDSMHKKDNRTFADIVKTRTAISDVEENHIVTIMKRNCSDSADGLLWHSDRALRTKSVMRMTEKQAQNVLASITVPMLLILGDMGFEKIKRNLAKRVEIMDALEDVKECQGGHYVHMQQPKEVADLIADFCRQR